MTLKLEAIRKGRTTGLEVIRVLVLSVARDRTAGAVAGESERDERRSAVIGVVVGLLLLAVGGWIGVRTLGSDNAPDGVAELLVDARQDLADGHPEDAHSTLTELIGRASGDPIVLAELYVERSFALSELGRHEEAIEDATAAIDLDPDAPVLLAQAYVNRSWDLAVLGRSGEAVADATRAIVIDSGDPVVVAQAHLHRSFAMSDLGRIDQAVADAEAVVMILPVDHELRITAEEWLGFLRGDTPRGP